MFRLFASLFFFFYLSISYGQLKGVVLDKETQKEVPFANLMLVDLKTGTAANEKGEFVFENEIPHHNKIKISALGYSDKIIEIDEETNRANFIIYLEAKHYHLHEAIVSSGTGVIQDYLITSVASKPLDELQIISSTNLGEAIANLEGVYNASTGNGIYKPVIRGLSGIRVISFLNGVKLENQQWGGDHGLGVASIGIGQVEVIKGPSTLLYGADALGGVLYLEEEPFAAHNSIEASLSSQVESNTMGINNGLAFKMSKNNVRFNVFVNQQNHADYQIPNGDYVRMSRYEGTGAKFLLGYNKKKWVTKLGYNYSNNTIGLPGHTHDSVFTSETFLINNQSRREGRPSQKIQNHFISFDNQFFFHESDLKITLGQMINQLAEYEKFTIPDIGMNLSTTSYYVRYKYKFKEDLNLITGLQGMYQLNQNMTNAEEQLIPNMITFDKGAFAILSGKLKKLNYQAGIRFDNREISTDDIVDYNFSYSGFNYSIGGSYKFSAISLRLNLSSGYRTPHVSELLSDGVHHGSQRYEIGNPSLVSEVGNQLDFGVEYQNEHFSVLINPFINLIQNYIYLNPIDSVIDENQVYEYSQADNSRLIGGELVLHYHPHFLHDFHLESNLSYVYADDNNGKALSFIPQPRLMNQIVYNFDHHDKTFKIENISIQHQFYAAQNRVVDYELSSNSFHLINFGLNSKLHLKTTILEIGAGVKNILNETYINHLSSLKRFGLPNPGRNIYLSIKYNFKHKLKTK